MTASIAPILRRYKSRNVAVALVVLCLHGLMLYGLIAAPTATSNSATKSSILVTAIIEQPYPRLERKLPMLKAPALRPVTEVADMGDLRIRFPPIPVPLEIPEVPAKALAVTPIEPTAGRNGSSPLPGDSGRAQGHPDLSGGSPGAANRRVLHAVSPIYTDTVPGTLMVRVFVDPHGNVKAVRVVRVIGNSQTMIRETLRAVKQWVFEPSSTAQWIPLAFQAGRDPFSEVFPGRLSIAMLNEARRELLLDSAIPGGSSTEPSRDDDGVRSLISKIQAVAAQSSTLLSYPLGIWGKVQSAQFLAFESRDLEYDTASREIVRGLHWQLYAVKQQLGTYLWLVGRQPSGQIAALEAMACLTSCLAPTPGASGSTKNASGH